MKRIIVATAATLAVSLPAYSAEAPPGYEPPAFSWVSDPEAHRSAVEGFQNSLRHIKSTIKITSCDHVMDLVIPRPTGRDIGFAGVCHFDGDRELLICNDTLTGKMAVIQDLYSDDPQQIALFLLEHCPPGG